MGIEIRHGQNSNTLDKCVMEADISDLDQLRFSQTVIYIVYITYCK